MHIHLPKPLHGWREFFGEVGIIMVGVLLALGAEYLIEQRHWREQAQLSDEAIKSELSYAAILGWERMAVQPCLQGRIRDLSQQLNRNEIRWTGSAMAGSYSGSFQPVLLMAYRAPSRNFGDDAWRNALANGTLNHLPAERVSVYSSIYGQIEKLAQLQAEEARSQARLTPLSKDRLLDSRSRLEMLEALADVDRVNSLMALIAQQNIDAVRLLHWGLPKADVAKARQEFLSHDRETRGNCVSALPLDLN